MLLVLRLTAYMWLARDYGGITGSYCHFDCKFYLNIATQGYEADSYFHGRGFYPNWAYFPLFPILIHVIAFITRWPAVVCGALISVCALWVFAFVGALYIQRSRNRHETFSWVLVVFAVPYGFFFSVPYTEALFAALTISVLLARASSRPMLAACLAAFAAATRPTGILLSIIVIADQLRGLWQRRHEAPRLAVWAELLPPLAIAPLGLTIYMAWQYWRIGDGFAFSHVQVIWDRHWLGPAAWIRLGLRMWDWKVVGEMFPAQSYAYNAVNALLGLMAAIWLAWRRRFAEAWICSTTILLPLSTGLHSIPRFVGTNPAFLLVICDAVFFLRRISAWLSAVAVLFMLAAQICLLLAWYKTAGGLY